jgi:hypothetical protein
MEALPTPQDSNVEIVVASPSSSSSSSSGTSTVSLGWRVLSAVKMTLSMLLTLFSVVVVSAAIFTKQTGATAEYGVHPIVALVFFWASMAWLAILEGGLNAMVGLQPIDKSLYKDTHRKAYLCTKASHKGENIERFIVGRQYLDLTIVFTTSFMVTAIDNAQVLGLPPIVNDIFLGSDLGIILLTIVFGQLVSVINCTHNMLDYINNWTMVASTYLALLVESTGILHAVYLVQIIFTKLANHNLKKKEAKKINKKILKKKQSDLMEETDSISSVPVNDDNSIRIEGDDHSERPTPTNILRDPSQELTQKPMWQRVLFWVRVVLSLAMSVFAVAVFSTALVQGNTTVRGEIPVAVSFLSLVILLLLGGFMEALQIALFAVKHLDQAKIQANPRARKNCQLILADGRHDEEDNCTLRSFLVGRQIAQTVIMFMIARIISIDMKVAGETMFGVGPTVQKVLFDSGLLNALVSTIFASLSWRVTANFFPMVYLGSPVSIWIIRLCLLVEGTGICDSAWLLAKIPAKLARFKRDEYYIAQAAATLAAEKEDDDDLEKGTTTGNDEATSTTGVTKGRLRKQSSVVTTSIGSSTCESSAVE